MTKCDNTDVLVVTGPLTDLEAAVLCLVNEMRAAEGVAPLTLNATLRRAAREQAMAADAMKWWPGSGDSGAIPHQNPVSGNEQERIRAAGYCGGGDVPRNENAYAWYFTGDPAVYGTGTSAAAAVDWWMHSEGHRRTLLDPQYTETGVGVVRGTASTGLDPDTDGAIFIQCFGGCPDPTPVLNTQLWAWGANGRGQVGDGGADVPALLPKNPVEFEDFVDVAANSVSIGVKSDGTVWIWGPNDPDDLTAGGSDVPVPLDGIDGVWSVAAGEKHVLFARNDGSVWAWGDNSYGQLGDDSGHDQYRPVRVLDLDGVVAVAAGSNFSLALRGDGTVWGWGGNGNGQFGMDTLSADGTAHYTERRRPVHLSEFRNPVEAIAAGDQHTVVVEQGSRQLLLCGLNLSGCIGAGDPDQVFYAEPTRPAETPGFTGAGIVSVAANFYNTYAVDAGGKVWAWGNNTFAQLGSHGVAEDAIAHRVPGLSSAVRVSAGKAHAMVSTRDHRLWTWGSNAGGQLGHGIYGPDHPPAVCGVIDVQAFAAGAYHSLAIGNRPM